MEESKYPSKELIASIVDPTKSLEEVKAILATPKNASLIDSPIDELNTYLIFPAARAGNLPLVEFLLEQKPDLIHYHKESSEADVLQPAVVSGNLELVKYLVSKGVDPHHRYFMETSILYFAVKNRHFHLFRYFVEEQKLDPNDILASNGIQALYIAMEHEDKQLFDYLLSFNPHIENIGPYNHIAYAARLDDDYYLNKLLERNSPFEVMDPYYRSAFSWAGEDNRPKVMELILKRAKGVKAEPLLAAGISKVCHEYNALCDKWQRLYDVYMMRYYCEIKRKEIEAKEPTKGLLESEALAKVYAAINAKDSYEAIIFKVPRNIFRSVMKYLDAFKPNVSAPEP
eukprot:TRINITY_DN4658_c0_g1_i5.p1 TRINITY_DN4658_c0_g1~~TRINITY_DN4658_c0_g1_i5.p1  ORF type:complete len:343 (+),score=100.20 TRINITY_DN4658_c0_g1_i5:1724-2752(+)